MSNQEMRNKLYFISSIFNTFGDPGNAKRSKYDISATLEDLYDDVTIRR
jgi:hypothetical protein